MRHQATSAGTAAYREFAPPSDLSSFVEACWFFQPRFSTPTRDILIPEGVVDLVFNFGGAYFRQPTAEPQYAEWLGDDIVVGQRNELFLVEWPVATRLFAIRLKPEAAYLFLDVPLHKLTNRTRPLAETKLASLAHEVRRYAFEDQAAMAHAAFRFLSDIVSSGKAPDARLAAAIRALREAEGNVEIQQLCDTLNMHRRTLERLFSDKVGVSPKFLARTIRLHHFLHQRHEHRDGRLTDTAYDAQYYDQSHLIKEFKHFTGESPAKFFNSPPEIYEPLLTSLQARRRAHLKST